MYFPFFFFIGGGPVVLHPNQDFCIGVHLGWVPSRMALIPVVHWVLSESNICTYEIYTAHFISLSQITFLGLTLPPPPAGSVLLTKLSNSVNPL